MEIKSPLSKAGMTIEEACQNKTFFLEKLAGTVRLKQNHDYYVQIQGQLYCSNLTTTESATSISWAKTNLFWVRHGGAFQDFFGTLHDNWDGSAP